MSALHAMYDMQRDLQLRYHGRPFPEFTDEERVAEIRIQWVALIKELGEALDEVGWKPWAKYPDGPHINGEAFDAEMVDAWHFFMNLMLLRGMTPDDLFMGYMRKNQVNHERITSGYDGVSSKCKSCRRAIGEPGVECTADQCAQAQVKPSQDTITDHMIREAYQPKPRTLSFARDPHTGEAIK